ncbi:MAG: 2OG-Fe(II) oxygenase, partial [Gammaproteobacteria bacterium]
MSKIMSTPTIASEFAEILSSVERPGDFYVADTTPIFAPHLEVEGVGPVALPLLPVQVEQLIAVADQAPYGRGEETLVDPNVRRTWQIDAERVRITGRHWAQTLEAIVTRAAEGLGVTAPVVAELYKLLVYDQGSFFVSHRDTEKAPGMFATLVIVLPSMYTGGELLVRHQDRQVQLDLRCEEPSDAAFAAFYADCVHEVLPVTSGCRLTLIYNLLRQGRGRLPEPPNYLAEQTRLANLLRRWSAGKTSAQDDQSHGKLIYPLEHAYTPAELAFDALKGRDAAAAGVVVDAAEQADCDLYLALISIEESGGAEHTGYYPRRWGRWDSDDEGDENEYEIGEVYDRSATLSNWCRADGSRAELGEFPFEEDELSPPDAFDDLEPDELHFHEATGNEGASFDRTYSLAALVLWPHERQLEVISRAGLSVSLPYLDELARRWVESGDSQESPLWHQAHELAGHMLRSWPRDPQYSWSLEPPANAAKLLDSLAQLNDTACIDAFLADVVAEGVYGKHDNEALIRAADLLPPPRAA